MVTLCAEIYVPAAGEKVGVTVGGWVPPPFLGFLLLPPSQPASASMIVMHKTPGFRDLIVPTYFVYLSCGTVYCSVDPKSETREDEK
jgi:hypothetical protein